MKKLWFFFQKKSIGFRIAQISVQLILNVFILGLLGWAGLTRLKVQVHELLAHLIEKDTVYSDIHHEVAHLQEVIDLTHSRAERDKELARIEKDREATMKALEALPLGPEELELLDAFKKGWLEVSSKLSVEDVAGGTAAAADLESRALKFRALTHKLMNQAIADDIYRVTHWWNLIQFVSLFFGTLVAVLIHRSVTRELKDFVEGLRDRTETLHGASIVLLETGDKLDGGTKQQSTAIRETMASIEEINSMIEQTTSNALLSQETAQSSETMVNQGSAQLHQLIQAIETIQTSNHEISHQFDLTNQNIEQILHMIAEIGSKTKVINDIVFQTKLLSFNASVEAARAGEYGKGFSVVAEEVGKLAAMSGEASKEISNLLNQSVGTVSSIREETKANVAVILDTAGQRLNQGTSVAESCKQVFASITDLVGQVRSNVEQISMAATEQTSGVKEIRRAMSALNNVVQGNGTVSSKVLGSAQAVSAESDQLSRSVDEMVALIGGRAKKVRDAA